MRKALKVEDFVVYLVLAATPPCEHFRDRATTRAIAAQAGVSMSRAVRVLLLLRQAGLVLSASDTDGVSVVYLTWARSAAAEELLHPPGLEAMRAASR
jgi:hypothetical protein